MSTSGTMNVASNCPSFDGSDYPYCKNKMRMHLEAIDKDLWDIVDKGIPQATLMTSSEVVKKNWQLDAKARSIIGAHLNKAQNLSEAISTFGKFHSWNSDDPYLVRSIVHASFPATEHVPRDVVFGDYAEWGGNRVNWTAACYILGADWANQMP